MRLVLDVECPVDRDVPEAEALAVLRVLTRIVRGSWWWRVEDLPTDWKYGPGSFGWYDDAGRNRSNRLEMKGPVVGPGGLFLM